MDVEVTVEAGKDRQVQRACRLIELCGLIVLLYGLASNRWWIAIFGAVMIFGSYALYRHRYGSNPSKGLGSAGLSENGGGGSDSDGAGD